MADNDFDAIAAKNGATATEEAPDFDAIAKKYGAAGSATLPGAKPGPYTTKLPDDQEPKFQQWVKDNKIPFEDSPTADYDMRGFWQAMQKGQVKRAANLHFPDTWKTPFHSTFSNESKYATPDAPHWDGDRLISKDGNVLADETPAAPDFESIASKYGATGLDTLPPGPPPRPGVPGLTQSETIPQLSGTAARFGVPSIEKVPAGQGGVFDPGGTVLAGVERMATGMPRLQEYKPGHARLVYPTVGYDPKALPEGAHQVIQGVMDAGLPALPFALAEAPLRAIETIAGAGAAHEVAKRSLQAAGATPAWAELGGDVISLGVVGGGAHAIFGKADAMLDAHNQVADVLLDQERRGAETKDRLDTIFGGEKHPVVFDDGTKASLEYVGTTPTQTGKPLSIWKVVDADGNVLKTGSPNGVNTWLNGKGAQADISEAPRAPQNEPLAKPPLRKRTGPQLGPLGDALAEMKADIEKPSEGPSSPRLTDFASLTSSDDEQLMMHIMEEAAERYRDIESQRQHYETGQDVPMQDDTMRLTTPEQRRQMLGRSIAEHQAIYDQFWKSVGKEFEGNDGAAWVKGTETAKLQDSIERAVQQEGIRRGMWQQKDRFHPAEAEEAPTEPAEEPKQHDFSSTQVNLLKPEADAVRGFGAQIPQSELAEQGLETEPHITARYGILGNEPKGVAEVLKDTNPVRATIGKLDVFKTPTADVLIARVDSPDLHAINAKLAEELPHRPDDFPTYEPHVTVAYLKPGEGDKYRGRDLPGLTGQDVLLPSLKFSGKDGKDTDIPLPGRPQFKFPFHAFGDGGPVKVLGRAEGDDFRVQRPNGELAIIHGGSLLVSGQPIIGGEHGAGGGSGAQQPRGAEGSGEAGGQLPVLPPGNGPGAVSELPGQGGGGSRRTEPQPDTRGESAGATRRVTGSADVQLVDEGRQQARDLKERVPEDTQIFTAPNSRSLVTGQIINTGAQPADWLAPWNLGQHEGKPLDSERDAINDRILNRPDEAPGVSPTSGQPGESFNAVAQRLLQGADEQARQMKPGDRILNITSGRALQILDAKGDAKSIASAQGEFSKPGELFKREQDGSLTPVDRIDAPGQYFAQHGATEWNQSGKAAAPVVNQQQPAPLAPHGAHSEPAREQIDQLVREGVLPPAEVSVPTEPAGMPRGATIEPEAPGVREESGTDAETAGALLDSGGPDLAALGASISSEVPAPGEGGDLEGQSTGSSATSRTGPGAVRGQEPGLGSHPGVSGGGVRDTAASVEANSPPRAPDVNSPNHERDYLIPDGRVVSGSPERRTEQNLAAIRTLRQIEAENRPATLDEQDVLALYVGWGAVPQLFAGQTPEWKAKQDELRGLITEDEYDDAQRSTTNAHFTSDTIVDAMWKAVVRLGAQPGMSWLEPAIGVGNFFGRQPADLLPGARRMGVDKDTLSGKIAQLLYPDSSINISPLEKAELPPNYFDGIISNVPFGDFGVYDPEFRGKNHLTGSIHNYFFAKAATLVRPGGVVAFVTSRYTMDGYEKGHVRFREWMAERMDLVGAIRLPSGAFRQNAGTEVITDVIFLRKLLPGEKPGDNAWTKSIGKDLKGQYDQTVSIAVNEYFHAHPEMILGSEGTARGMFSPNDYNVKGQVTPENLQAAIEKLPADQFKQHDRATTRRVAITELGVKSGKEKKGGIFLDKEGNAYRKTGAGSAEPVKAEPAEKERLRGQLAIRDVLVDLLDLELKNGPTSEMDAKRKDLNRLYDAFVKKHKALSTRTNQMAMLGDPDAPLLLSLERNYNPKDNTVEKTPIFERRVLEPPKTVTSVGDPKEALSISLNETASINWERMAQLTGKSEAQVQKELTDAGLVFVEPLERTWQTAEEYLSGSVRKKLEMARSVARMDPQFEGNVTALEKVQPTPIPVGRIRVILGAPWVPVDKYSEFASDILGGPIEISYAGGEWFVSSPRGGLQRTQWDTARVRGLEILKSSLNLRQTKVYDRDSDGNDVINRQETLAASVKAKEMNEKFQNWLLIDDVKRGAEMAKLFNDLNNDIRDTHFDGSHLTLPGMSRTVLRGGDLMPHQKSAVWRGIVQPNVLLAHAVGAGKTFEMIAIGMELKRLGLIKRPMYNVPNETLGSWQDQFRALYPQARVLVLDEKNLDKKSRQQTLARIQTQEWDAVVVPHSAFQKITTSDDLFEEQYEEYAQELEDQITAAEEAGLDPRFIKRLEKAKERMLERLLKRRNSDTQDLTVTWEGLGIDQLFVDESHKYKKLGFSTKQANVAGIDQNGNQRTFDLMMKIRHVQKAGRGVVFATGTPVTNTMGELFSIMRYLIDPEMKARGLGKFDEWAASFGRTVQVFEPKIEGGGYQTKSRFAKFVNLRVLSQLFRTFADVVTADMVDLPIPKLKTGARQPIMTDMNEDQKEVVQYLRERAAAIRANPRDALPDNLLAVYTDAQKMALDVRMLLPDAPDDPNGRLSKAADKIYDIWKDSTPAKGVQLVFADFGKPASAGGNPLFSPYDELIRKLKEKGIPAAEIAHIYEAKNKPQRERLFDKVRRGDIRVIMGSTDKMGVGVNIQNKAIALHHLDIPHRPDQLEQREGRIMRQGNENPEAEIYYYLTRESLDESKFGNVVRKGKFINDLLKGNSDADEMEDVEGMVPSLEMFQAMVSGDPRVLRKMEVDAEVERLSSLKAAWRDQKYNQISRIDADEREIRKAHGAIEKWKSIEVAKEPGITAGKQKFSNKEATAGGEALYLLAGDRAKELIKAREDRKVKIGEAFGQPVYADGWRGGTIYLGDIESWHLDQIKPTGVTAAFAYHAEHIPDRIRKAQGLIEKTQKEIDTLQSELRKPWGYEDKLDAALKEQEGLFKALGGDQDDHTALAMNEGEEVTDSSVQAEPEEGDEEETEQPAEPEPAPGVSSEMRARLQQAKAQTQAIRPPKSRAASEDGATMEQYKGGNGRLRTPDTGWLVAEVDGKPVFSDGHLLLQGAAPGEVNTRAGLSGAIQKTWEKFTTGKRSAVRPVAFSKTNPLPATGGDRLVWLDDSTPIDARYYDAIRARFKDAEFEHGDQEQDAVIITSAGKDVGLIMGVRGQNPPAGLKAHFKKFWREETGTSMVGDVVTQFIHQSVLPGIRSTTTLYKGVWDDILKLYAPHLRSYGAERVGGLTREAGAELAQRMDRAKAALEDFRSYFEGETVFHRFEVIDSIETGDLEGLNDYERRFVSTMRALLEPRQNELKQLGLLKHFIENYFPHIWKKPEQAEAFVDTWLQRRPMAGSEAYKRRRSIPTIREGMDDPDFHLEPAFDNPVDFVLAKLGEVDKSITAHQAFNELRANGTIQYIPSWRKPPAGMKPIDDRLFVVRGPRKGAVVLPDEAVHAVLPEEDMEEGGVRAEDVTVLGKREMGRWYAVEPVAQVLNNHLAPSPYRGPLQNVFKAWSGINRTLNMIELSASAFHAMTTSLNASISDIALSMAEMQHLRPLAAAKALTRGLVPFASIAYDMFRGTQIQRVWDGKPGDPMTVAIVDVLKAAGGRARQDQYWTTSHAAAFMKTLRQGGPGLIGLPVRGVFAALEVSAKPIMTYMVPRAKLSAFAKRAQLELERNPDMTHDEARKVFGDIWNSIDNRFGQLVQDNMLMNRSARGVLNALVGRPGWNIGTVRELGGGALDLAKAVLSVGGGKRPQITDRSRYLIAMLIVAFLWNAILNYALTGDMPRGMDFLMPRDGGFTEDGHPSRVVLPFYVAKDVYSYFTNFKQTILNKLSPALTMAGDLFQNRDYYHRKIYGDGGVGMLPFLSNFLIPYAAQGVMRDYERGEGAKMALPLAGVMPATRRASLSDAEIYMQDYFADQRPGTLRQKTERQRTTAEVTQQMRAGHKDRAFQIAKQGVQSGNLQWKDIERAVEAAQTSPLVAGVKRLPLETAIQAEKLMTPAERQKTMKVFADKVIRQLPTKSPNERKELWDEIQKAGLFKRQP